MREVLIRAVVAAPIVILLPAAWVGLRPRVRRCALSAVLMLAALAPYLGTWRAWAIIAIVTIAGTLPEKSHVAYERTTIAGAGAVTLIVAAIADQSTARHAVAQVAGTRNVVIVFAGAVVGVFLAGAAIGRLMHPFAARLTGTAPGIERAGRMIGWLERALLFGLIVVGAPDAAAIVIAAKSVARFPAFRDEAFAEYYLIGTLMSFLAAAGTGVAVRAALGLPLLTTRA